MRVPLWFMPLIACVCACGADEPSGGDAHAPADSAEPHVDEPAHAELPRRVHLAPEVVREAGIETTPAAPHAIARTVTLPGELVADPDRSARVGARLPGVVVSVAVRPGDAIEKDGVLAVVRAPDLQTLRANTTALAAKAASTRANAQRLRALVEKRLASEQEAVTAAAEADALEAEARAARERLRATGASGSRRGPIAFEVRSPIAGVVTERNVVAGDAVTATTVLATVVSVEEVWFVAHVFEHDVARVAKGSRAVVQLNAWPDDRFDGQVTSVSYQVDPGARTLSARIPLQNRQDKLRLGLFGTASVVVDGESTSSGLAVPRSAVTKVFGKQVVFVRQADGDFELHEVVLGQADADWVEVLHGLREGELVVSQGVFNVQSVLLRNTFGEDPH